VRRGRAMMTGPVSSVPSGEDAKIIPLALPRRCQLRNRSREGAAGAEGYVISAGANAVHAWKFARGRAGHRRAASVARGGSRSRR